MLTFCNSYFLWLLRCVQLRLVTVTFCDINVVWWYILSQYRECTSSQEIEIKACLKKRNPRVSSAKGSWWWGDVEMGEKLCMRLWSSSSSHRVHRVATSAFLRTFHHEGRISPGWWGGGGERPPPFITFIITSKVAVHAPAEWAETLTLFHL